MSGFFTAFGEESVGCRVLELSSGFFIPGYATHPVGAWAMSAVTSTYSVLLSTSTGSIGSSVTGRIYGGSFFSSGSSNTSATGSGMLLGYSVS